jgi:hypothetical protein
MQRDWQILISVLSKILGWTLRLAIAGLFSIALTPWTMIWFFRGRRYIWWEYARWVLTGVFLGVFVYKLRNLGFHWQELYFLPILGAVSLTGRGLSQIRPDSPWRWLAWAPKLTGQSFHVDVAAAQGVKLLRGSRLVRVTAPRDRRSDDGLIHWGGISIPASEISALPNLQGYLITMGRPIARIVLEYAEMPMRIEPFIRREQAPRPRCDR